MMSGAINPRSAPREEHQEVQPRRMSRDDRVFSFFLLAGVIGIPALILWASAHFDPRVPPCLKSHTENDAGFPLFAVPPTTRTVCDEWTIKR